MKKRETRKLSLAKETLRSLEAQKLQNFGGGGVTGESICYCDTQMCASQTYTLCPACNS